jgi:hypothetical protein
VKGHDYRLVFEEDLRLPKRLTQYLPMGDGHLESVLGSRYPIRANPYDAKLQERMGATSSPKARETARNLIHLAIKDGGSQDKQRAIAAGINGPHMRAVTNVHSRAFVRLNPSKDAQLPRPCRPGIR